MKKKLKYIILVFYSFFYMMGFSQNIAINTSGATASASALLDISSTTQGILIPRITDAQRQALQDPATGLVIYNTTSNELNFYNGTGWQYVPASSVSTTFGSGTGPGGGIAVNNTGSAADPSAILDVSATDKGMLIPRTTTGSVTAVTGLIIYNTTTNQINYYDGTAWQAPCDQSIDNTTGSGASAEGIAINTSGGAADVSAELDLSSTTQGLLIPRMTSAQRDAIQTPAQGLIIYNNTDNGIENWTGTAWYEWGYSLAQPSAITGSAAACQGSTGNTYSVTNVGGVTYTWTYDGTGMTISSGQGTNAITADFSGSATSGTLSVTPSNSCGNGTASILSITVSSTPPAQPSAVTGTTPVCAGTNGVTYSVTNVAGVTYTWAYSGIGLTVSSGQGTNAITANFSGSATSGTLSVTPSNGCGNGTASTLAITIVQTPAQPSAITGTTPVCAGTNGVGYSVTNVAGVTYTWTYDGTGMTTSSGQGTNAITTNFSTSATSGTLSVTPSNATCGNGTVQAYPITVTPYVSASSGGTISYLDASGTPIGSPVSGGWTVHTFNTSGTFSITTGSCVQVQYLVVAGGGGGGGNGAPTAGQGGNSVFSTITATGGGHGANSSGGTILPGSGGSGGGSYTCHAAGGTGSSPQGQNGGIADGGGGGGGGYGSVGGNGTFGNATDCNAGTGAKGGQGGTGYNSSISGVSTNYAGGGGGGAFSTAGTGGSGVGGHGAVFNGYSSAGTTNRGGGGGAGMDSGGGGAGGVLSGTITISAPAVVTVGAAGTAGGTAGQQTWGGAAGGSGIVIVRYVTP